jgi:hypothetical protein
LVNGVIAQAAYIRKFVDDTTGAVVIFDDPAVGAYVGEILHHASESVRLTHKLRSYRERNPEEQRPMAEQRETHRTWCQDQLKRKRPDAVFRESLQLEPNKAAGGSGCHWCHSLRSPVSRPLRADAALCGWAQ